MPPRKAASAPSAPRHDVMTLCAALSRGLSRHGMTSPRWPMWSCHSFLPFGPPGKEGYQTLLPPAVVGSHLFVVVSSSAPSTHHGARRRGKWARSLERHVSAPHHGKRRVALRSSLQAKGPSLDGRLHHGTGVGKP